MTNWGWYWRIKLKHVPKTLCSQMKCIDSFDIFKNGFDQIILKYAEREISCKLIGEELIITLGNSISYSIHCEKQACRYGGYRFYFRCPHPACRRRMRKLYGLYGIYACRKCLKLCYRSQRQAKSSRMISMKWNLIEKLELEGGNQYKKPKWMRWKTFDKLNDKIETYDKEAYKAHAQEFPQLYRLGW